MDILVTRNWKKDKYTIGRLYINGTFFCNTIEDVDRGLTQDMPEKYILSKKVYGETAIPTGKYTVKLTNSAKFKRVLPLIENVKGYSGVRIHRGNTAKDSLGCIIVGKNTCPGMVTESAKTEIALMKILNAEKNNINIEIRG